MKKRLAIAFMEKYKNLGQIIVDEKYYEPPEVDESKYDLTNELCKIQKGSRREAYKRRDKEIDDMKIDQTSLLTYLISNICKESLDKLQGHKDWESMEKSRDPLELWKRIKESHQALTMSKVASVIKKIARICSIQARNV